MSGVPACLGRRHPRQAAHAGEPRDHCRRPDAPARGSCSSTPRPTCASRSRHARAAAARRLRDSPIAAVVLTGAEVDQTAGLLTLRERGPFALYGRARRSASLAANSIFGVLAPDVVSRRPVRAGERFALPGGLEAELFPVPGKVAALPRRRRPALAAETEANVGIEIARRRQAPGVHPRLPPSSRRRSWHGCAMPTSCCSTARSSPTTR